MKPTRIITDPEELKRLIASQPPVTRERAIASIQPRIPTKDERAANARELAKLHPGNRFRLMFGMPLLTET